MGMSRIFSNGGNGDFVLNPFTQMLQTSTQALLATPYFTEADLLFNEVEKGKNVQLLIGLNEVTCPRALQKICGMSKVSIRYFTHRFHAKIFIFDQSALLGSANLTDGGLRANREAVIVLESKSDPETLESVRVLFAELWEMGEVLTPEKLEIFKNVHGQLRKNLQNVEKSLEKELGKTQPRNIDVESLNRSKERIFLEKLRREVHEQYLPAFNEVIDVIRKREFYPQELANLEIEYVANRFLHYLRETHARGVETLQSAPILPFEERSKLIAKYYEEWINATDKKVQDDYRTRLETVEQTFGSAKKIKDADKNQIMNGLMSLHAFSNRYRYVAGGKANLSEEFLNNNKLAHVKSTLSYLLHGDDEFIKRFHDFLYDPTKILKGFGYFNALELYGTIKPRVFPPINGRMAKTLRFLGFEVRTD